MSSQVLLPYTPSSVSVARRRLSSDLRAKGVYPAVVDDAAVVLSELLSNALRHARPLTSGQLAVTWKRQGSAIEVAVSDGGSVTEPRHAHPPLSALGGRGLGIVDSLADRWGVRHDDGITTVWAQIEERAVAHGRAKVGARHAAMR